MSFREKETKREGAELVRSSLCFQMATGMILSHTQTTEQAPVKHLHPQFDLWAVSYASMSSIHNVM